MSILKSLRERVAPELNHLYVVPPSEPATGFDCGWHGAEHALHTYFVATMFGAVAEIDRGDFAVISQFVPPITSINRKDRHAWCTVNGGAPVDLSMTFAHFGQVPQLRGPIVGTGRNGDWHVHYAEDESALDEGIEDQNELLFIERSVVTESAEQLLENPYAVVPAAKPDDATSWPARFGAAIYAQISLHCFRCATGEAKSIRQRMSPDEAVSWIAANYPDAAAQILIVLRNLRGGARSPQRA